MWWQQPFFQVALSIIITFIIATWYQSSRVTDLRDTLGKRIDDMGNRINDLRADMNARFDAVEKRLDRIEIALADHATRITMLEERTSPLRH